MCVILTNTAVGRDVLEALAEEKEAVRRGENVLVVTHGDILAQWVDITARETVMECGYCSWAVSKAPAGQAQPVAAAFERVAQDSVMAVHLG
jgi:hypothetical protein